MGQARDEEKPLTLPVMPGPVPPTADNPPIVLTVPKDKVVVVTRHSDAETTVEIVLHETQSLVINGTEVPPPAERR